jgi:conjugative transfer signal peptidase TraF
VLSRNQYDLWLGTGVTFLGCLTLAFHFAGIRMNVTPSIPLGLYIATPASAASGQIAEFCPSGLSAEESARYRGHGVACPDREIPLLKPIVATKGDRVEFSAHGISVNGRLIPNTAPRATDGQGRPIHAWPAGVYTVDAGHVVVASDYHPGSYDSRYLGPIPVTDVRSRLRPLWVSSAPPRIATK